MPTPASTPAPRRRWRARMATALAVALTLGALGFVVARLAADWEEVSEALAGMQPGWLAAAVALAGAAMVAMALPWTDVLADLGVRVRRVDTTGRYFVGEVAKYLPGGVWPVLGRAELVARVGVPRRVAYVSVATSLGLLYLAAAVFVTVCAPLSAATPWGVAAATPLALAALHPAVVGRLRDLAARLRPDLADVPVPTWSRSLLAVARYLPAWVLVGTATWFVALALEGGAGWADVAPAAAASWIVGFVVVPVPGGVGVREAAFVALVATLPDGTAAAVALVARAMFMVVDAGGAVVASVALGVSARSTAAGGALSGSAGGAGGGPSRAGGG